VLVEAKQIGVKVTIALIDNSLVMGYA